MERTADDADCEGDLDALVDECLATHDGQHGWDVGVRLAEEHCDAFVGDMLRMHPRQDASDRDRDDLLALSRTLMLRMAHGLVDGQWQQACHEEPGLAGTDRRRAFKRGVFAGFLCGMADSMCRAVSGVPLVTLSGG